MHTTLFYECIINVASICINIVAGSQLILKNTQQEKRLYKNIINNVF